jgi:hypothetical protein
MNRLNFIKAVKTRLENNLEILKQLETFFVKNPDQRFVQGLWNCDIIDSNDDMVIKDRYSEESYKTLNKIIQKF